MESVENIEQFRKLGICEPVLQAIVEEKFETPTEIQEKAIPYVTARKDIIAQSATGSGKTLVFGAGIVQNCERGRGIQSLIVTPTRELAEQNTNAMITFSRHKPLTITSVYGGVSINRQIDELRDADIVVATPGRLLDHLERGTIDLHHVKILVLDEADRMLDMGFIDDVEKIIRECPRQRQTLLFSATMPADIIHLAKRYMSSPAEVSAVSYVDASKLKHVFYDVPDSMKFALLVHLIKNESTGLVMVFCNTRHNTDFIAKNLKRLGINALAIHGGFSQAKRSRTMEDFKDENIQVLVCTDVAARGLDIKGVSHVYNYDTPKDSKDYIHRVGRTARAGNEGKAITILGNRDYENFRRVQGDSSLNIVQEELPQFERVELELRRGGRRFGGRGGGDRGGRQGGHPQHRGGGRGAPFRGNQSNRGRSDGSRSSSSSGDRPGQSKPHYGQRNERHGEQRGGQRPSGHTR